MTPAENEPTNRTATSRWSWCAPPSTRRWRRARWIGRGEKESADGAAVDAMRLMLDTVAMRGTVVIGEGEKDEAPMLFNGEEVGDGSGPEVDVAVDPLEGTELCANGMPNSLATIAVAEKGAMFDPGPNVYMMKMATSDSYAHLLDLDRPIGETLKLMADEKGDDIGDLVVIMLDRPRHEQMIADDPRGRRAHPPDPPRRRLRRAARRHRGLGGRPALRHRRHARGRALGRGHPVPGRQDHRPRLAPRRRREAGRPGRRLRPGRGAGHRPPLLTGRHVLLRHRGHRRRLPARRALRGHGRAPRRHHRIAGHALALGHGPPRERPPRPRRSSATSPPAAIG